MMTSPIRPAVLDLLVSERNTAADDALLALLPDAEEFLRPQLVAVLIQRGQPRALGELVDRFPDWPASVRAVIEDRVQDLSGTVRHSLQHKNLQARLAALELLRRADDSPAADLLVEALRSECRRTQRTAGRILRKWASALLDGRDRCAGVRRTDAATQPQEHRPLDAGAVGRALSDAMELWDRHRLPDVLTAALWLIERTEPVIRRKIEEERSELRPAILELLVRGADPRLAPFSLCALAIPQFKPAAVAAVERNRSQDFTRALLRSGRLLADPAVARGLAAVRELAWMATDLPALDRQDAELMAAAVEFVAATGVPRDVRLRWYRDLLAAGDDPVRRAVLWQLVADRRPEASHLLSHLATDGDAQLAVVARRELIRRGAGRRPSSGGDHTRPEGDGTDPWDVYWNQFDTAATGERLHGAEAIRRAGIDILAPLRRKLASAEPVDRVRALRIAAAQHLEHEIEGRVFELAHDPDPVVRATAVLMLARFPGGAARRILRMAMEDPDERVQANAVEALDAMQIDGGESLIRPKLGSPHARVRANAVKSLLKMEVREAGEALLNMLSDASPASRLSALWVVERLELSSIVHLVGTMAEQDPNNKVRRRALRVSRGLEGGLRTART